MNVTSGDTQVHWLFKRTPGGFTHLAIEVLPDGDYWVHGSPTGTYAAGHRDKGRWRAVYEQYLGEGYVSESEAKATGLVPATWRGEPPPPPWARRRRIARLWAGAVLIILFAVSALLALLVIAEASVRATADERTRTLPGDDLVANPLVAVTHALTIRAAPRDVWPWLVQMGAGRAGWYGYDRIDNGGQPSAERILPEYQELDRGTILPALPGATDAFVVLEYETERSLVLGWVPPGSGTPVTTWTVVLVGVAPGCTRLIERGRVGRPYRPLGLPEWLARRLAPLAHGVMVRKHMLGIARRAERGAPEGLTCGER